MIGTCDAMTLSITYEKRTFIVRLLWQDKNLALDHSSPNWQPHVGGADERMLVVEGSSREKTLHKLALELSQPHA